jgi:Carboxymuconolactone decarboxylase family
VIKSGGSQLVQEITAAEGSSIEGWIQMIGVREAEGALKEVYGRMRASLGSRPAVYSTPNGDAPNIVKSHSLEPEGLRLAFGISTAIHWSDKSLPWAKREMINTVTSRANDCFY